MEVLLGSLGLDVLSVTFHEHPLKGALRSHQSNLPCSDGAFSTELPLSVKELLL
jgi:hypothetical protein